ncbi:kinase-like protein [Obba rivulosa]|uniref:non-specific serine/threonine protein kinase n=1 Tax=Obba rivulosa TaxID=1052685 RepID=A0A8E2DRW3_9APHY|nr:kinase-like protein [Obba rivulosa]
MATTALLSQHSSNPLEVPSSDMLNRAYLRQLKRARGEDDGHGSSDDPLNSYNVPELEHYHSHLAQLYPNSSQLKSTSTRSSIVAAETSKPMMSDDELDMDHVEMMDEQREEQVEGAFGEDEDGASSGEDEDASAETDEEMSIFLKPPEEQEEIRHEIAELENRMPQLTEDYKIVDRLGTGTFSSVYKAVDLGYHEKWDNTAWHGSHPPTSSAHYQTTPRPPGSKVFVAVKRIYVTSGPERIRNEIMIMEDCRGCRHVSQLITAFRQHDQVVAIMPYHRNEDFRGYFRSLPMAGVKAYFRCMFRALRDIHARGIIHRDVKPANFLYDPRTGIGTLCDFGLACRMERGQTLGQCLHTAPSRQYPHGRIRSRDEYDLDYVKRMQKEGRMKSSWPSDRVGYPQQDLRPVSKANRAGTRGFRAPEVLLKCGEQTGAIDVWSAGMILLFFLTGKFPLFNSSDDTEALMELAAIFGRKRMETVAILHSRIFMTNIPSHSPDGISWREFVERLNPDLRDPPPIDPQFYPYNLITSHRSPPPSSSSPPRFSPSGSSPAPELAIPPEEHAADITAALDFLEGVMHPESTRRLTPREALAHPFLREPDAPADADDAFAPHPFGEGICAHWHLETEDGQYVRVRVNGVEMERRVAAGEGIAIGRQPCEFHRDQVEYGLS